MALFFAAVFLAADFLAPVFLAALFFAAVFLLGLFVVPPLFIAAYLVTEARTRLVAALFASLVASTCLYAGMALLGVDLWTGSIAEIVPGILGGGIIPPL